jgi:hypothetical protein
MNQKAIDSLISEFVKQWGYPDSGANAEFESALVELIPKIRPLPPPSSIDTLFRLAESRLTTNDPVGGLGRQGGKSKGTAVRDARAWRLLVISVAYPPAHSVAARTGLSRQTEALSGRFIEIEVPSSGIPVLTQAPPEATSDIARCARKKPAALD